MEKINANLAIGSSREAVSEAQAEPAQHSLVRDSGSAPPPAALSGGVPSSGSFPKAPAVINADLMAAEDIHADLKAGYDDLLAGRVHDADTAFADFRRRHPQR